jgi:serine protease AprX
MAASVGPVGGFGGNVSLSLTGLPSGATATISSNPLASGGSTTLLVKTTRFTPRGTYLLRLSGSSGGLNHQVTATLTVT